MAVIALTAVAKVVTAALATNIDQKVDLPSDLTHSITDEDTLHNNRTTIVEAFANDAREFVFSPTNGSQFF